MCFELEGFCTNLDILLSKKAEAEESFLDQVQLPNYNGSGKLPQ